MYSSVLFHNVKEKMEKYRKKFSCAGKYLPFAQEKKVTCAVVIPSFAESSYLPKTLMSLAKNAPHLLLKTCVVIVLNSPRNSQSAEDMIEDTLQTLNWLSNCAPKVLNVFIARELDGNTHLILDAGVGEARKIGMDIAIELLDANSPSFIASLDADTLVEENYLDELFNFFKEKHSDAAIIDFTHQTGMNDIETEAVKIYEQYLKNYVEWLRHAGSPYAFHTIGSAMAFTPKAYIRAGGMKLRKGGEDFYFLQALKKTGTIGLISETTVHPSARFSTRTPFGTGNALKKIAEGKSAIFHNPEIFEILKIFFLLTNELFENPKLNLEDWLNSIDENIRAFLKQKDFPVVWMKILRNTADNPQKRKEAFHSWFDAFKTLKFIHFCEIRNPAKFAKKSKEEIVLI